MNKLWLAVFLAAGLQNLPLHAAQSPAPAWSAWKAFTPLLSRLAARPPALPANDLAAALEECGYAFDPRDGSVVHKESGARIGPDLFARAGLAIDEQGRLAYLERRFEASGEPVMLPGRAEVSRQDLPRVLAGLLQFARARAVSAGEAGRALQEWGIPPSYDGKQLINPDGSATYFGLMLFQHLRERGHEARALDGERLGKALNMYLSAFHQAFNKASPDVAAADLDRAWGLLAAKPGAGAAPLDLRPYDLGGALSRYEEAVEREANASLEGNGDSAPARDLADSMAALAAMRKVRYHRSLDLNPVPPPALLGRGRARAEEARPPLARLLPALLRVLDKLNGGPLDPRAAEAIIRSFPMGDTVWRMGVRDLWRDGLTGKGVKVAVIDTGVGGHPELDAAVKARENFTHQRGAGAAGVHATHVAGTIHALAPEAEIRSYKALDEGGEDENERLSMGADEVVHAILAAVDRAVKDGNQVINLSLGGPGAPNGVLAAKIEEYARQGVIFVVSAGNGGPEGVSSPSAAETVISAGALTATGRPAGFSSYGAGFDSERREASIKTIFMAPGTGIVSTQKGGGYMAMDGTSMAAPHLTGAATLLVQGMRGLQGLLDPVEMSRRLREAFAATGRPIPRRELPAEAPADQDFIVVDPVAAWRRLSPPPGAQVAA